MDNEVVIKITANDDTAAGAASARANMTKLGDDVNTTLAASGKKAGDSLGAGITQGADGRLRDARGRFVSFGQDVNDTMGTAGSRAGASLGDGVFRGADGRLRDVRGRFVSMGNDIDQSLGESGSSGGSGMVSKILGALNSGASKIGGLIGPKWGAGIAAGIVLGGPIVAGAMAAVTTGGVIAAGAAIQKDSPLLRSAWHDTVGTLTTEAQSASAGMVKPISEALETIKSNLVAEAPAFQTMFSSAASDVPILTRGIDDLVNNSLPGLQAMVAGSNPILNGLADAAGSIGSGISDLGMDVSSNSDVIGQDMHDMGDDVKVAIDSLGQLTVAGANFFHEFSPELHLVTEGVKGFSDGLAFLSTIAPHLFSIGSAAPAVAQFGVTAAGTGQNLNETAQAAKDMATEATAVGGSMTAAQEDVNSFGTSLQGLVQDYTKATAGAKYLEDSHDQATITAGQAVQSWQSLRQAVTSASASYDQAKASVSSASQSVVTAEQGVESARHSEAQATLAVGAANDAYKESLYQQKQAQDAVTAAEKATEQQLVSLTLQAESAATSQLSAKDALFKASQEASKFGIDNGNVRQIAGEDENGGNAAAVEAAIALLAAQDQLAQAQNSASTTQDQLNVARKQGVAGNPQVLAAEHALGQANDAVAAATQGVADAEYNQQQAARQVANAEAGVAQASAAVTAARRQELAAEVALTTARDATTRSIDQNTLAGAQNRQEIEGIFEAYVAGTGSQTEAAKLTEKIGDKMGFTRGQIDKVITSVEGLDGKHANFGITGTPSIDMAQLVTEANSVFKSAQNFLGFAAGGSAGGLAWVGEQGPEIVNLPPGSTVYPHSNSMQMLAAGEAPLPGFAAGGVVGSLRNPMAALTPAAADWAAYDAYGQTAHALGAGPSPKLPPVVAPNLAAATASGATAAAGGGSHVSGNRAANKAIMQQVFGQFGWGSGAQWAAQDYLEMREAGYDNYAQNPTSTAFGMGQFLNSTWASVGMRKTADPALQSIGMRTYEAQRYGSPIGAAQHERAYNWYSSGGGASGLIGVGEHGPELLRVPNGSTVYPHANAAAMTGSGGAQNMTVTMDFAGMSGATGSVDALFSAWFKESVRTGKINLRVVPGNKVVAG